MQAVRISAFGSPLDVAELVDIPEPGEPSTDEALLAMEYAPISQVALVIILGLFGERPRLPTIGGYEGVARVLSVGSGVHHIRRGDHVLVTFRGCWCERLIANASDLFALPGGVDLEQLSLMPINGPTARLMLSEFVSQRPGDWVIQNAATSGIARAAIAIAAQRGVRTVNIVRRAESVDELKAVGGDVVLVDGPDLARRVAQATENARLMLGLDGVGGEATTSLASCLGDSAVIVCYATARKEVLVVPALQVIFRDLSIRSFWARSWYRTASPEQFVAVQKELVPLVASGAIQLPIAASYPLSAYRKALVPRERGTGPSALQVVGAGRAALRSSQTAELLAAREFLPLVLAAEEEHLVAVPGAAERSALLASLSRELRPGRLHPAQHGTLGNVDTQISQQLHGRPWRTTCGASSSGRPSGSRRPASGSPRTRRRTEL